VNRHEAPRSASPGQPSAAASPASGPAMGGWPAAPGAGVGPHLVRMLARIVGVTIFVVAALSGVPPARRPVTGVVVAVIVGAMAFAVWNRRAPAWRLLLGLAVATAAADVLYATQPSSVVSVVSLVTVPTALIRLSIRQAAPFVVATIGAVGVIGWLNGRPGAGIGLMAGCLGVSTVGISIRAARERAATAERLLTSERETVEANARTQVLAERQRLAREIHDILAHTLSAQIVQLENARLLLSRGAGPDAVRAQIDQAQRLAREGLAETKRALYSLRGDARPLPQALAALAETAGARLDVEGEPRAVEPEASLAMERTVQEALTNVRKHAPGAAVDVTLRYLPEAFAVEVVDSGGSGPPLSITGSGHGLTGMRERAELLGGRLEAGPDPRGTGYRVALWIPG
jgi:signal transduction histidine kinase